VKAHTRDRTPAKAGARRSITHQYGTATRHLEVGLPVPAIDTLATPSTATRHQVEAVVIASLPLLPTSERRGVYWRAELIEHPVHRWLLLATIELDELSERVDKPERLAQMLEKIGCPNPPETVAYAIELWATNATACSIASWLGRLEHEARRDRLMVRLDEALRDLVAGANVDDVRAELSHAELAVAA